MRCQRLLRRGRLMPLLIADAGSIVVADGSSCESRLRSFRNGGRCIGREVLVRAAIGSWRPVERFDAWVL